MEKTLKAKSEIPHREWVEFELTVKDGVISHVEWHAQGGTALLLASDNLAREISGQTFDKLSMPIKNKSTSELMLREVIEKITGQNVPYVDEEICHCRKINRTVIDKLIVLGAHTPEKIRSWSTAGSGCGTCRPDVEKLIKLRVG